MTPHSVTFRTCAPAAKPRAYSAGTVLNCRVEDGISDRMVRVGGLHPETTCLILFPLAPPIDAAADARAATASNFLGPDANAGDVFDYTPAAGPARRYVALGPATDEGGESAMFAVPCKLQR
jgi:hypothetical protein